MKNIVKCTWFVLLITIMSFIQCSNNDSSTEELTNRIDSLFMECNKDFSPGAAVSILKDNKIIFKKGYGMADLEHNIPLSPSSVFDIASETKQFTAFCIVLLAQQGKITLDDDIRKYLPKLPYYGEEITVRDLIYHLSGLRDYFQLMEINGTVFDNELEQQDALNLIYKQKRLNYIPGDKHLYSNTGYVLLTEIIKNVSGKSYSEFANNEIFKPLGMQNTHIHDNYKRIVKNRAFGYEQIDSVTFYNRFLLTGITIGDGGVFTTVEDEAKWLNNFYTAKVGGVNAIRQMHELGVLNSGDTITYAFGINIDSYRGWQRIGHGGTGWGYRSYVVRFPEKNLGITVFSNHSGFDALSISMKIADIFLEDNFLKKDSVIADYQFFKDYAGKYCSNDGIFCELIDSTGLFLKLGAKAEKLIPLSNYSFAFHGGYGIVRFNKSVKNSFEICLYDEKHILRKYIPWILLKSNIEEYTGIFENNEVDTQYEIAAQGDSLVLSHVKYDSVKLTPVALDQFSCKHDWMNNINFIRNNDGKISGFEINYGRVLHLYFEKK